MGKIKVMFLCLLIGITGVAYFFLSTKPNPTLRDLSAAYQTHQQQLKKNPRDPRLLYNEAWFLGQQQKYAEALTFIQQALNTSPKHPKYLYTRAWLYQKLGKPAKANRDIALAKTLPLNDQDLIETLRIHLLNNSPAEGLKKVDYELAKQLEPPQGLFYWRSLFHTQLKAYDAALGDLDRLLKPNGMPPAPPLAEYLQAKLLQERATLHDKQGHYKEALSDLKAALELKKSELTDPQKQALQYQVFHLQRYSDPDSNIAALKLALKDHFQDKNLHYLLIDSLLEKGELPTAKEKLLKARTIAPEDATLWCLQARYQFAENNLKAAKISLQEAQKQDTEGKNPCIARETLRQLSDTKKALRYWNSHVSIQPLLSPALQHKDFENLRKSLESP